MTRTWTAAGSGLRRGRALAVSVTAWCTAAGGHAVAGGALPGPRSALVLVLGTAWLLTPALRARASTARLVTLLVAAQALMHVLLTALHMTAPHMTALHAAGGHGSGAAHARTAGPHAAVGTGPGGGTTPMDHGAMAHGAPPIDRATDLVPSPGMVLGHLAAAVVLGCVLACGERAAFAWLSFVGELAAVVATMARLVLATGHRVAGAGTAAVAGGLRWPEAAQRLAERLAVGTVSRRGPPRTALPQPGA